MIHKTQKIVWGNIYEVNRQGLSKIYNVSQPGGSSFYEVTQPVQNNYIYICEVLQSRLTHVIKTVESVCWRESGGGGEGQRGGSGSWQAGVGDGWSPQSIIGYSGPSPGSLPDGTPGFPRTWSPGSQPAPPDYTKAGGQGLERTRRSLISI